MFANAMTNPDVPPNDFLICHCPLPVFLQVRSQVEEHRLRLGLTREQVIFSTDMHGSTSGTYGKNVSRGPGGRDARVVGSDVMRLHVDERA